MFDSIKADIKRYVKSDDNKIRVKALFYLIFTQGAWAIIVYRYGAWCREIKFSLIGPLLRLSYFFLNKFIEISTGISISSDAKIGKGLYVGHFGGIFINKSVEMGENCNIGQGVTVGTLGVGKQGSPIIGSNVYIGTGAKILGDITIGSNVKIGANAVVVKNIPDNATAVGIPAKVVRAG
jgi:serine O-acetyltransferase